MNSNEPTEAEKIEFEKIVRVKKENLSKIHNYIKEGKSPIDIRADSQRLQKASIFMIVAGILLTQTSWYIVGFIVIVFSVLGFFASKLRKQETIDLINLLRAVAYYKNNNKLCNQTYHYIISLSNNTTAWMLGASEDPKDQELLLLLSLK